VCSWQPALSVKTADGFIVDVTNTTDGRVALIAAPDAAGKSLHQTTDAGARDVRFPFAFVVVVVGRS
jgi:hypothetical protein